MTQLIEGLYNGISDLKMLFFIYSKFYNYFRKLKIKVAPQPNF